jgi:hypothetical protein
MLQLLVCSSEFSEKAIAFSENLYREPFFNKNVIGSNFRFTNFLFCLIKKETKKSNLTLPRRSN